MLTKIKKLFAISVFLLFSLVIAGCHQNSAQQLAKNKEKLREMYQYFSSLETKSLKLEELKKYYTPQVRMIINGVLVSKGYGAFYKHFELMLKKSHDFQFVFPKHAMIAENNRVAVKYNIVMHEKDKSFVFHVIAFFDFKHHRIKKWDEVVAMQNPDELGLKHSKLR